MLRPLFIYLQEKPWIGMASGAGSGAIGFIQTSFLTNDAVVKVVSALGIWAGLVIALMTIIIKTPEVWRVLCKIFKSFKKS